MNVKPFLITAAIIGIVIMFIYFTFWTVAIIILLAGIIGVRYFIFKLNEQ